MMSGETDIFHLIKRGKVDLYKKRIGSSYINIRNQDGQSLLHKAIGNGQNEIAFDLLERSIDVNMQDNKGLTALHYLGFYPNVLLAQSIIDKGGELELKDFYGNTPLWYAVFNARGNYEFVRMLLSKGADPTSKNNFGKSPFDFAAQIKDEMLLNALKKP